MNINLLVSLLEMSINTYHDEDLPSLIYKYGYDRDGMRCKLFDFHGALVLAIKGTSLNILGYELGETSENDKEMVNIMFKKCKRHRQERDCEYLKKIKFDKLGYLSKLQNILTYVKYLYPNKKIFLTGHSLGGTLASLLSPTFDLQCVTFSSPGDLYISRILQIRNKKIKENLSHFGMCNDSIFSGRCDRLCKLLGYSVDTVKHNGRVYCLKIRPNIKSVIFHNSSVLLTYLKKLLHQN
ncbi:putative lipase ATG15 [Vairimorpha necatrix]|uniref:triacylglycerol lipase n=1 Tax=Vairimorpha necatrix TaxID=6039 RepID=A0AAX4J937_9MICR